MHAYQAKISPRPTKLIPSRLALLLCIRGGVQARATLSAVHLLVRGAEEWVDREGEVHALTRPVTAVCRCGGSARQPWCDGTHKVRT